MIESMSMKPLSHLYLQLANSQGKDQSLDHLEQ